MSELKADKTFVFGEECEAHKKHKADAVIRDLQTKLEAEIRKAKRALWIARACRAHAEWAHWATIWFRDTDAILNINKARLSQSPYKCTTKRNAAIWRNMWHKVEHKCRVKAEEHK